jgi:hypothetical protein
MKSFKPTVTRLEDRITPSPLWNIWCRPPCCAVVIALPTGYALGPALPPGGEVEPEEETMRLLRKAAGKPDFKL